MTGRKKRFRDLDLQLEAISDALAMARGQTDPERRAELLDVVERAFEAYREAHRAASTRPQLRLLQGGAIAGALVHPMTWMRDLWRTHPATAASTAAATAAVVGVGALAIGLWPGGDGDGDGRRPPVSGPSVIAPPRWSTPPSTPSASPSPSGSSLELSPSASRSGGEPDEPLPDAPSWSMLWPNGNQAPTGSESPGPSPSSGELSPSSPGPSSTDPDPTDDDPEGPGPEDPGEDPDDEDPGNGDDEEPDEPGDRPCLIELDLPLLVVRIDHLVCL